MTKRKAFTNSIAVSSEDKKIYAIKVRNSDNIITQQEEITTHSLNVVAKYLKENNIPEIEIDFGKLSLSKENPFKLNERELLELNYHYVIGFKFIARNENGFVCVFKEEPVQSKGMGYGIWIIENHPNTLSLQKTLNLGQYSFLTWEKGVFEIQTLIA